MNLLWFFFRTGGLVDGVVFNDHLHGYQSAPSNGPTMPYIEPTLGFMQPSSPAGNW